jgi:flagellar biosynthesis protein FlhG
LCCYGLFEPHEIEKLRAKLDEAFDVLLDPSRRRPYEMSVFRAAPEPVRERSLLDDEETEPRPPPPDITPDTQFTGQLLRQVRESQGVELRDISQKSKVGMGYLKAIEDDDFERLPAVVYATGFVSEFARFLKLDPQHVSRSYIARYRRYLQDRGRM